MSEYPLGRRGFLGMTGAVGAGLAGAGASGVASDDAGSGDETTVGTDTPLILQYDSDSSLSEAQATALTVVRREPLGDDRPRQ